MVYLKRGFKNKRAQASDALTGRIIFLVLNVVFFASMLIFIARAGVSDSMLEQRYAKKIGLLIDSAKPGTVIEFNLFDLYEVAKDNRFSGAIVRPDGNGLVVQVSDNGGYKFDFFSDVDSFDFELNEKTKSLVIRI